MNMLTKFDEIPAMTLQDIKETKLYGRMHAYTDGWTDNVKTVYQPQTKFAGGITNKIYERKTVNIVLHISFNICFGNSKEPSS